MADELTLVPRSLLLRCLQFDTAILSACAIGSGSDLLLATPDRLLVLGWAAERAAVLQQLHSHASLLHATAVGVGPGGSEGVLVVSASEEVALYTRSPGGQLSRGQTAELSAGGGSQPPRLPRPVFSAVHRLSEQCSLLAASLHKGVVQLVTVQTEGGTLRLEVATWQLADLVSATRGATLIVESIAIVPGDLPSLANQCCVVVLYTAYGAGGMGAEKCVACLHGDIRGSAGVLKTGPWFIRNLHPTTSLVYPVDFSAAGGACGVLVASSNELAFIPACAPYDRQAIGGSLEGVPTCAAVLEPGGRLVLGDSQGGLYCLDLQQQSQGQRWLSAVQLSSPVAAASSLVFLHGWSDGAGSAAGLLFVGSQAGPSCFVEVPWEAVRPAALAAAAAAAPGLPRQLASVCWEVMPGEAAGLGSLAPIRDAAVIPDPSGCGDARLLVLCGNGGSGRLALARWAAGLVPVALGGDSMQGPVHLLPLKESPAARHHRYLLFGFGAAGSTSVLDIQGTHFQQATIPGLCLGQATLACSPMAGGHLLQVTPHGAFVIKPAAGEVVGSWPCPVSMAAVHGQYVALASGTTVHCLHVSGATGRLQLERSLEFPQQVSALSLFEQGLPEAAEGTAPQGSGEVWVAVGQWVSNAVLLQQLSASAPACQLSTGDKQPRSLAALHLAGRQHFFIGTSTGELLWWELGTQLGGFGAASIQPLPRQWARAGAAPVELQPVHPTTSSPYLLAKSDQLLVVSAAPDRLGQLAVRRVHGGQSLAALCPIHTADLPSSLAWVSGSGDLTFGRLDASLALRWDSVPLGATPALGAYHPGSHCTAVACCDSRGRYSLRLVDVGTLAEVARLPMAERHTVTAVCTARLPCSGADGARCGGQPGCKQFLLIASCLEGQPNAAAAAAGEDGDLGPAAAAAAASEAATAAPSAAGAAAAGGNGGMWWRDGGGAEWQHTAQLRPVGGAGEALADGASALHGLLSVFEIRQQQANSSSGGSAGKAVASKPSHELVLHGTIPLPTVIYSLAAVEPEPTPFNPPPTSQPPPAGEAPPLPPMLVAGCHDGLRLYRAFVDDAGAEGHAEVERGLRSIAVVEPLQFASGGNSSSSQDGGSPGGPAAADLDLAARRLWHQRVALQLVAKAPAYSEGIPVSLQVVGPTVFCGELFASVTAVRVQPPAAGQLPALIPCSADASGSHTGGGLPLSSTHLLAGMRPRGLALLRRNPAAEAHVHAAARRRFEQVQERGQGMGEDEADAGPEGAAPLAQQQQQQREGPSSARTAFIPSSADTAELEVVAACGCPSAAAAICPGQLGLPVHSLRELGGTCSLEAAEPGPTGEQPAAAVVASTGGAVYSVGLLGEGQFQPLFQLQQALQQWEGQQAAPLPGELASGHGGAWSWSPAESGGSGEALGGNCIDADFVAAALRSVGGAGQAPGMLGVPAEVVRQAMEELSVLERQ